ncbi:MAG: hypothetical protein ABIP51_12230 [Bacteroidia bacterium]
MIKLLDVINESISSAKQRFVKNNKIGEVDFSKLQTIDITLSKKYIDKICQYFIDGISINDIDKYIKQFNVLTSKGLIKEKDINAYKTFNELKSIVDENKNKKTKSEMKTDIKMNEAKKIYEDDRYLVIMPLSKNASCTYGAGTKWCISATNENMWKNYTSRLVRFYFIFDKQLSDKNPLYKIAVAVYPDGKKECYNAKDELIDFNEYINETTIPESTFEYVEYSDKEKLMACIDGTYKVVDGLINVKGNVNLAYKRLIEIPFKFGTVTGNFDCSNNNLTSLKGCPTSVGGYFVCFNNKLTSLQGCPTSVGDDFVCADNKLITLKYSPQKVGGDFYCMQDKKKFTEKDVRKYCDVKGKIFLGLPI